MQVPEIQSSTPSLQAKLDTHVQGHSSRGISDVRDVLHSSEGRGFIQSCVNGIFHTIASVFCMVKDTVCWFLNCCSKKEEVEVSDLAPAKEESQASLVPEEIQIAMDVQDSLREGNLTSRELLKYFQIYVSAQQQKEIYIALGLKAHDGRGRAERLKAYWDTPTHAYHVNIAKDPEIRSLEMETKGRLLVEENPLQERVIAALAYGLNAYINEGMQRATQAL